MISFLVLGCSGIKVVTLDGELNDIRFKNDTLTYLYFTSEFKNNKILVHSEKINFKDTINTSSIRGLAKVTSIRHEDTEIYIDDKLVYRLKAKDFKDYQFIYISKPVSGKPKFLIEITNEKRVFF